ncbi:Crp/Fnr family transcriptional regulator [Chryseobacterium indoltheticum]|uniref:cAMP regulatory protein n=1 Tax=Chryseobacterium indoltheticum TaxID=254 RepID=A0A381FBD4_9FLAO|nr:Crp/Fnr family transcriptional regulator [Chryseobacterium indoltheticum]AZA73692.1 Crp/Fnr family transcriptional regulator [Chryseobacterium indoltheticum]SIQ91860.1 cAMP-binding domain of CRP or a regulatory subunit of cAMP-dependent protein kinases [Chryseobacterium indoltheticum]SUX43778.1 cAMP regulatory protein [Chryseobacterium indoltheticum]
MLICEELLLKYGGICEEYKVNDEIFIEGSVSKYYFQIRSGVVEINNYDESGKEFTQHILFNGQSIGESFLIGDMSYTVNAVAKSKCTIIKILKPAFVKMLDENPEVSSQLFKQIAYRLSDKYYMLFTLISQNPESKIESILQYLKKNSDYNQPFSYEVPLTRKQIANLTGLRVETVIRTVKKLERNNKLRIREKRIFC